MSDDIQNEIKNDESLNGAEAGQSKPSKAKEWRELLITAVIAFVVALLINTFIFSFIQVNKTSMVPTFNDMDVVFLNKTAYWFNGPASGDVVVFRRKDLKGVKTNYIKRVIGVPGDKIEIKDGKVYRNGIELNEPYIAEDTNGEITSVVPEGKYFVMGDNRNVSLDSKSSIIGLVDKKEILGRVFFKFKPWGKVERYKHDYADRKLITE